MNIGFDAKRAFHNNTGLGNYSRTLIQSLSLYFPQHNYFLFNPKKNNQFTINADNIHEITPQNKIHKIFSSIWRSKWVITDLLKNNITLYHGLSHEIPVGIQKTNIKAIVTIHDLIYIRYSGQFNPVDLKIYNNKFKFACKYSDHIIAISNQTKNDIIQFFGTDANKISVCYQSCNPIYKETINAAEKKRIKTLLGLPDEFFLYVGSIIERKNLLNICKAMLSIHNELPIPLVVIGKGNKYKIEVESFLRDNKLSHLVIFLSDLDIALTDVSFKSGNCFPAIYQSAIAMIYPSFFEGFGIPIIEALWSKTPVITSSVSCLPEAAGPGAFYVNPANPDEIAQGMKKIYFDKEYSSALANNGWDYVQKFSQEACAKKVMEVYNKVC